MTGTTQDLIREQVSFESDGVTCRGDFLRPAAASGRLPAIVMAHGLAAVRTMDLPSFAEAFAAAGYAVLLFDYRSFGESDGEPRGRLSPSGQLVDFASALTWLEARPEVDGERLGIWGTSLGGGHAITMAATDRRVRCAVAQVPAVDVAANSRLLHGDAGLARLMVETDRRRGAGEAHLPVVARPGEVSLLPPRGDYDSFMARRSREAPTWSNLVTVDAIPELLTYRPQDVIAQVSPTPLMMIILDEDRLTQPEVLREAFELAGEPRELVALQGGHFDIYDVPEVRARAINAARSWFDRHL